MIAASSSVSRILTGALLTLGAATLVAPAAVAHPREATQGDATQGDAKQGFKDPLPDENGTRELKRAARHILERIEVYKDRLQRLDSAIGFYQAQRDGRKVQQLQHLRQREVNAFQGTLAEYRRLLGDRDFERLSRVLRYLNEKTDIEPNPGTDRTRGTMPERVAARDQKFKSERARAARAAMQQPARPSTPDINRSVERQLMVERARASQRMQLAQRIEQARQQELRRTAAQQQRFGTPPTVGAPPAGRSQPAGRATPAPAAQGRGSATRPQVPPRRRP